jgi:AcrR family transcriptional regulator
MPISDCEVRDPRIRRTRQLLQEALRTLLWSKKFDEISVQDIAEAATVNRATFYDHYADKFALADALIASGFHQLLHDRQVQFDGTCLDAAAAVIQATCDFLGRIRTEHSRCSETNSFQPIVDAAITSAIRRVLTAQQLPDRSPLTEMAVTAASWAIYGAARQWSFTPNRSPVADVVPQILVLVLPILQQANPHPNTPVSEPVSPSDSIL